jgi:hypothetical protein
MVNEGSIVLLFGVCVLLPIVLMMSAMKSQTRKTLFWTLACLVNPVLMLIPFFELFSPAFEIDNLLSDVYGTAMLTGGPLGFLVSILFGGFNGNFPYDRNWLYFAVLLIAWLIQWAGIWLLGNHSIRRKKEINTFLLFSIFLVMFAFGCIHTILFALCHC